MSARTTPESTASDKDKKGIPAGKVLDTPPLSASDLKSEIGDSETWDEASEPAGEQPPEDDED